MSTPILKTGDDWLVLVSLVVDGAAADVSAWTGWAAVVLDGDGGGDTAPAALCDQQTPLTAHAQTDLSTGKIMLHIPRDQTADIPVGTQWIEVQGDDADGLRFSWPSVPVVVQHGVIA